MRRGSDRDSKYPGPSAAGYELRQDRVLDGEVVVVGAVGGGELAVQELDHVVEAPAGALDRRSDVQTAAASAGSGAAIGVDIVVVVVVGRFVEAIEYLDGGASTAAAAAVQFFFFVVVVVFV